MNLLVQNKSETKICLRKGDILGTIKEGVYGTCPLVTLNKQKDKLLVINNFCLHELSFDSDYVSKKSSFINKYSYSLLQILKWPEEILLFFKTKLEAMEVLEVLFPNPGLVEAEKI